MGRIASADKDDRVRAAAELARGEGPEDDDALLALLAKAFDDKDYELRDLLIRVLAERDPDRDPDYALRFSGSRPIDHGSRFERLWSWMMGETTLSMPSALPRLRRLRPVELYTRQLRTGSPIARMLAASQLGETRDKAAMDVLVTALGDRSKWVRLNAVLGVRRLVRSGAVPDFADHPARRLVADLLTDRHRKVRVAAAQALCTWGDTAVVAAARKAAGWRRPRFRRDLDACLRDEIPPLPKTWPGDPDQG